MLISAKAPYRLLSACPSGTERVPRMGRGRRGISPLFLFLTGAIVVICCAGCSGARMSNVSYQSAQTEAAAPVGTHQRDPWGNFEAKPGIHEARMEDAGSLLAYRQNSGIDLYDIIDGRPVNTIFANESRNQDDLYEERRLYNDSGSFDEYVGSLMSRRTKIGYPSRGPTGESLLRTAKGSGLLLIEYGVRKRAMANEPAQLPIAALGDLYDVSGNRRPKAARTGEIIKRGGTEHAPVMHIALARTSGTGRGVPAGIAPSPRSSQVPAAGLLQEEPRETVPPQTEEHGSLNVGPQRIPASMEQGGGRIEADRQDVHAPLLSSETRPSDAGRIELSFLQAETTGSLRIDRPGPLSGPLVLRDPAESAALPAERQAAQPSSSASLPNRETGGEEMPASPASSASDRVPAMKTDGGGTPGSVARKDEAREERSGSIFSFLAASPERASGQNRVYRGIPTPRLDSVTRAREDRDLSRSERRWWGKNLYAR